MMPPIVGGLVVGLVAAAWKSLAGRPAWQKHLGIGAGGLLVGLLLGWWWGRPVALPPEPPAPSIRQADGSLVLERVNPGQTAPQAPHVIPAGGKEERRVSVVVKPPRGVVAPAVDHPVGSPEMVPSCTAADSCDCPPVQVDLSLVRMPDKTRRVIASSPDGKILSGVDVPIEAQASPRIPRWTMSAIAVGDVDGIRPGVLMSRRFGPIIAGAGILSDPGMRRPGVIGQLGVSW